ncbi:hypothetical protein FDECE_5921 [Fusarium decemcellulare]|nr:hypothetical protein FDECE_5921 [Fusarium decemcellulare]
MLDDEFLDAEIQPAPIRPDGNITIIAFFVKSLELFEIVNDIQYEIHQPPKDANNREINRLISVLQLDNRLVHWAQSLPDHLGYNTIDQEEGLVFRRQRVVLRARYLYARISVLRPVLSDWYLKQTSTGTSQHRTERSLSQPLVEECATLCFETAHEMIDVLFSNFNFDTVTGPVPAWWFGVLCKDSFLITPQDHLLQLTMAISYLHCGNRSPRRAIEPGMSDIRFMYRKQGLG